MNRVLHIVAAFIALSATAYADSPRLLHSERSLYREVLVYQTGDTRCMCFTRHCRVGRQSCMDMDRPDHFSLNYTKMMLGALYLKPQPRSVLIIGLGGGTLPRALMQLLPHVTIDSVEIDPAVVKVARKYFDFSVTERSRVIEQDARVFVKRAIREKRSYDLIMLDAFDHEYIPEHLLTQEFLREVRSLLTAGGILAANTFSSSRLYDHESVTYASVFGTFYNLKRENRVVLAANGPLPSVEIIRNNSHIHEAEMKAMGIEPAYLLPLFTTRVDWNTRARVLTDQYSPANLLNIE